jgi:hypothetical protein
MHLISMKGLVVYILKKCENKIIYKSNLENTLLEENIHLSLLEGWKCDKCLNLINFIALWPNFYEIF